MVAFGWRDAQILQCFGGFRFVVVYTKVLHLRSAHGFLRGLLFLFIGIGLPFYIVNLESCFVGFSKFLLAVF